MLHRIRDNGVAPLLLTKKQKTMYQNFSDATPLAMLTVAQFKAVIADALPRKEEQPKVDATPNYIYGLAGIKELFGVSHATAQKLKNTVLAPAVKQCGRKIVIDARMAIELFSNNKKYRAI